jgi:hypothetical protein
MSEVSDATGYAPPATEAENLSVILFLRLLKAGASNDESKPRGI